MKRERVDRASAFGLPRNFSELLWVDRGEEAA
jgi:hypothetical protein